MLRASPLVVIRDGNAYPKSEIRWVFAPLRYKFGSIFRPVGLLMGTKSYPLGLWARVCSYNTRTREPMGFLNPVQHRAIVILFCEFITNLASFSFNSYFDEPLMFRWWVCVLSLCSCRVCICMWWIYDFAWCYDHLNIELVSEHRFLTHNTLQMMFTMLNLLIIKKLYSEV